MFESLRPLLAGPQPATAPLVLNPLMALMAEQSGFRALYLGGGATGYAKAFLEANLTLTEMAHAGAEIAASSRLPIILDGAGGWGDPMHIHRTIAMAEAAGFAAIEIEDVVLPKRAHHHAGVEHLVSTELMEAKVREAVAARRNPQFVVIARTNAADLDEAVERARRYRSAGADALLVTLASLDRDQIPTIGEQLGPPLVYLAPHGGLASANLSLRDLGALGYRLVIDGVSLTLLMYEALLAGYRELARPGFAIRRRPSEWAELQGALHATIGLDHLLAIEKATVEEP
jgi:2-methylisocitrate lyase-like PEP mutase family enzyme